MTSMSVSLPDKMRTFIKSRVQSGDYHNESEYIRDLIRKDKEQMDQEVSFLEQLSEAIKSGESKHQIPEILKGVKEKQALEWLNLNRDKILAHNKRVAQSGVLLNAHWTTH